MTVRGELNTGGNSTSEVFHERHGILGVPQAKVPRGNEFGNGIYGHPCPYIAEAELTPQVLWKVLFLGMAKRPYLVALNPPAGKVTQVFVLISGCHNADILEELEDGTFRYSCHAAGATDRKAFDQRRHDPDTLFLAKPVDTLDHT